MRGVTSRRWQVGLAAALVGLVIGPGHGLTQEVTSLGHHPAHIHSGSCAQLDPIPVASLTELEMDLAAMEQGAAIPVLTSATTVAATLSDLLASPHAIDVHELRELAIAEQGPIACGDLGGQPAGDLLAVGVRELNGSGLAGIALLQGAGDQTTITLYLAHGLSGEVMGTMAHAATAQITFYVATMGCPGCGFRVDASVRKAPGILDVTFNGPYVTVTYDPSQVSPEEIAAAIAAGGDIAYEVTAEG